jgi:hypothetical protein
MRARTAQKSCTPFDPKKLYTVEAGAEKLYTVRHHQGGQTMKGRKTGGRPANGATASITICLQPELKEALKEAAKEEGRSVSDLCALALRDFILERDAGKFSPK